MSEVKLLSGAKQPGRPAYTDSDKNRFYGDIWLLGKPPVTPVLHKSDF